jgi:hypothetical protein
MADALAVDDLDRALTLGLLDARPESMADACAECTARAGLLIAARESRLHALAARERYRAREARLAERAKARARKRALAAPQQAIGSASASASLPPAAAAALARAKARAAAKRPTE